MRARDLGIEIGSMAPGPKNAITDVAGVRVGMTTLIEGDDVRTGVTVVIPPELPLFAGFHSLNGNGELTGTHWIRESGLLTTPIAITNTHSVGVVHDALIASHHTDPDQWSLPVVGETSDAILNDMNGFHVTHEHVLAAVESASDGPVPEGNVGGGTGMTCHEFKGGTGTASRVLPEADGGYSVGVLVQANQGWRHRLAIEGVPVGREIPYERIPAPRSKRLPGSGSIIAVVATDAPLIPSQCERLAQRVGLGVARTGGTGENSSGDIFLAFATGNRCLAGEERTARVEMLRNEHVTALFLAVIEATEEAIVNALVAAETMTGRGGTTAYRLEPELLVEAMRRGRPSISNEAPPA